MQKSEFKPVEYGSVRRVRTDGQPRWAVRHWGRAIPWAQVFRDTHLVVEVRGYPRPFGEVKSFPLPKNWFVIPGSSA